MEQEKWKPGSDHDLLIALNGKVDRITDDIGDLKNGMSKRLSDVEDRVNEIERLRDMVNPVRMAETVRASEKWINDFKIRWQFTLAIGAGLGGLVGFILSTLMALFKFFGRG